METKVLIVTYYWPPSGGAGVQRCLKFVKYLPYFGIEPIVLTVENPTYPIWDPSLEEDIPDSLPIYKSNTIEPFKIYTGLSREKDEKIKPTVELKGKGLQSKIASWLRANIFIPDARIGWLITAKRKATQLAREHNIHTVLTSGPPHSVHFVGKHLKKKTGARWLADFRDPWSGIYYNKILPRTRLAQRLDEALELSVLKSADEVIVVTKSQLKDTEKIYEREYQLIPNGYDPEDFLNIQSQIPDPPPLIIRYIGSIGETRIPEALLKVLASMPESIGLKIEFIGHVHKRLSELIEKYNLQNRILVREYLPHRKALEEMCSAHWLLLCIPERGGMGKNMIPGKMFEYLGSGRPIFLLGPKNGDAAHVIRDQNAGIMCSFHDEAAIRETLDSMYRSTELQTIYQPDDPLSYSRKQLTKSLSELILQKKI
ncbi:MAG: glycosyltransferase [Balneolaceae bacterium]